MSARAQAALVLFLILAAVFYIGTQTGLLGPYSDTLHLIILSSVLFGAFLIYTVTAGRET